MHIAIHIGVQWRQSDIILCHYMLLLYRFNSFLWLCILLCWGRLSFLLNVRNAVGRCRQFRNRWCLKWIIASVQTWVHRRKRKCIERWWHHFLLWIPFVRKFIILHTPHGSILWLGFRQSHWIINSSQLLINSFWRLYDHCSRFIYGRPRSRSLLFWFERLSCTFGEVSVFIWIGSSPGVWWLTCGTSRYCGRCLNSTSLYLLNMSLCCLFWPDCSNLWSKSTLLPWHTWFIHHSICVFYFEIENWSYHYILWNCIQLTSIFYYIIFWVLNIIRVLLLRGFRICHCRNERERQKIGS